MEGHFVIDHSSVDQISKKFFVTGHRMFVPDLFFHFLQIAF